MPKTPNKDETKMAKTDKKTKTEKKAKKSGTTYNLHDFAKAISEDREGVSTQDVHGVLKDFCDSVASQVTNSTLEPGDKINFPGIGALCCLQKKARKARNPKTGESVDVAARPAVKFKLSSNLKQWGKPVKAAPVKGDKKKAKKK